MDDDTLAAIVVLGAIGGIGDTTAPTVTITSSESSPSFANPIPITFTLSEVATDFAIGDITVGAGGTIGNFAGSGMAYTADLTITTAAATVTLDIAAGAFHDAAGNENTAATQFSITSALILFDKFTTDDAAPMTTPRTCEPGPGTLVVTDTTNVAATASGLLVFSGRNADGDPGVWGPLQTNAAGLALRAKLRSDPNAATYIGMGWDSNQAGAAIDKFVYKPNVQTAGFYNGVEIGVPDSGSYPRATLHEFLLAHRGSTAGMLYLIKANGGSWVLAWIGNGSSATSLYPVVNMNNYVSGSAYADDMKSVSLPSPFTTANGLATQVLAGARSQGDTFTHTADCFIEFVVTTLPSSGQHEIQFRKQDATNYWQVTIDSTGALDLDEVVAGTPTQRGTAAGVIANGDRVVIRAIGTTINVLEGTVGQASRITYTSASNFATSTAGSLLTLGASGAVSNIISWPRTITGAALTVLNAAFP